MEIYNENIIIELEKMIQKDYDQFVQQIESMGLARGHMTIDEDYIKNYNPEWMTINEHKAGYNGSIIEINVPYRTYISIRGVPRSLAYTLKLVITDENYKNIFANKMIHITKQRKMEQEINIDNIPYPVFNPVFKKNVLLCSGDIFRIKVDHLDIDKDKIKFCIELDYWNYL